jgi:hypothetical protein
MGVVLLGEVKPEAPAQAELRRPALVSPMTSPQDMNLGWIAFAACL